MIVSVYVRHVLGSPMSHFNSIAVSYDPTTLSSTECFKHNVIGVEGIQI